MLLRSSRYFRLGCALWVTWVVAASPSAEAAFIGADDPTFGSGAITRDTTTGLEWLDLSISCCFTYDQIATDVGVGGAFESFRFATLEEVFVLWEGFGVQCAAARWCASEIVRDPIELAAIVEMVGLLDGLTGVIDDRGASPPELALHIESVIQLSSYDLATEARLELNRSFSFNSDDSPAAYWIVRPVPEAGTALLLGLGLVGLALPKRLSPTPSG